MSEATRYKPVDKFPDFPALETAALAFWAEADIFNRLREKNRGGPKWRFLDGPITANNPMGVHHAWGRTLKDLYQRYHAMCGCELRYQNGFDCQGLWVEVEVEKELGFESKKDIAAHGMDKFVEACMARVRKFSEVQTAQSVRLGYWMDWENSYFTMNEENNYAIWGFLKKCSERDFVYKGFDAMPWCPRCGVGISQMEMHEGYKWVEHVSVFVRMPIRGREKEAFLVWTTTPWTLTANVAVAVHPEMKYYKLRQGEWQYYVGAENYDGQRQVETEITTADGKKRKTVKLQSLPSILKNLKGEGEVEIVETLLGKDLLGLEYDGPFDELPAQAKAGGFPYTSEWASEETSVDGHRVIAWDAITGSEGTGIVHSAPGCGQEDYHLSKENKLVAISPLDEGGRYAEGFGPFTGRADDEVTDDIIASLKEKGLLVGRERYPHRYAHCWRCKTPIVYRLVDEWYISMAWREKIQETVSQIRWIPGYGEQREMDWLNNMGDWMISKKRFWGLALPIWQCEKHAEPDEEKRCDGFTVIGSREELQEKAIAGWDEFDGHTPHRPWIDNVKIRCETCGATASRIPDVGNPWLDAGIVPYSTMGYDTDRDYWQEWFPPDLVLECFPGQFRNWFYSLLAMNAMMQQDQWDAGTPVPPPFRTLLGHALVRDENGQEMHKSRGNAVEFNAAAETIGAEIMRYIYAAQNPIYDLNFPDIAEDRRTDTTHLDQEVYRKILTLWNCYSFYITYAELDDITPAKLDVPLADRSELDRWILSKFQSLVGTAHQSMDDFAAHLLMEQFEKFLDSLSNWYLRRSRRRFWKSESDTDKLAAYATLFEVLEGLCRLMAPILPFLTEHLYQNIVRAADPDAPESVHLQDYPVCDDSRVDAALEARIDTLVRYKNLALRLRTQHSLKIRQPLGRMIVKPATDAERAILADETIQAQLLEEINVKTIEFLDTTEGLLQTEVRPNFKVLGQKHGPILKAIQAHLKSADPAVVLQAVAGDGYAATIADTDVTLLAEDLDIRQDGPENLAFLTEADTFVALDTTLTPDLLQEGIARDFVRQVQQARKDKGLEVSDRIQLRYRAEGDIPQAVEVWADYIQRETLATELTADETLTDETASCVKVGKAKVWISI